MKNISYLLQLLLYHNAKSYLKLIKISNRIYLEKSYFFLKFYILQIQVVHSLIKDVLMPIKLVKGMYVYIMLFIENI